MSWVKKRKLGLPRWLSGKVSAFNAGDVGLIPGSGRSAGEGNDNPTPVFLPGKSHRGAWQATVHEVTKESDTTLPLYNNKKHK